MRESNRLTTLKTVSMYLRSAKTEAEEAGISTDGMAESVSKLRDEILSLTGGTVDIQLDEDTYKSTYQIMKEISEVWDSLTDVTQANILEKLGGKRNANVVAALISNFGEAEEVLKTSANAAGSALAENEKYLNSIEGKVNQFKSSFEALSSAIISSDLVKGMVDAGTTVLDTITAIADVLGGFPTVLGIITAGATGIQQAIKGTNSLISTDLDTSTDKWALKMSVLNQSIEDISARFKAAQASGQNFFSSVYTAFKNPMGVYEDAISNYNALDDNMSASDLNEWINGYSGLDDAVKGYLRTLNGGKATLSGFIQYCKANGIALSGMSLKAKAATIAVKGLGIALNTAFSVGVGLLINFAISKISEFANRAETIREEAVSASEEYESAASSLSSYKSEIASLNESLASNSLSTEEAYEARSRLLEIQGELQSAYGAEANSINLVTMSADEAAAALDNLAVSQAKAFLRDNAEGIEDAKKEMDTSWTTHFAKADVDDNTLSKLESAAKKAGVEFSKSDGFIKLSVDADAESAAATLEEFKAEAEASGIDLGEITWGSQDLGTIIDDQIGTLSNTVSEYGEIYQQYIEASITANTEYSSSLKQLEAAQTSYEQAVNGSYTSESERTAAIAKSISQIESVKEAIGQIEFDDKNIRDYFETMISGINELYAQDKLKLNLGVGSGERSDALKSLAEYKKIKNEIKSELADSILIQDKISSAYLGGSNLTDRVGFFRDAIAESKNALDEIDKYISEFSLSNGSVETVDGMSIAFTPVLHTDDGDVSLDQSTVSAYLREVMNHAAKDGKITESEIFKLDSKGFKIFGQDVHGIISAVGEDADKLKTLLDSVGGSFTDTIEGMAGSYGKTDLIGGLVSALDQLDANKDGITETNEILAAWSNVESGADVIEADANAVELLGSMASQYNMTLTDFLNTLSELGYTKGYIGDGFAALADGLTTVTAGFNSAAEAAAGYKEAMEGGEKDDSFSTYAEAYATLQEEAANGTTHSNAFMNSAEFLFGSENLHDWEYNADTIIAKSKELQQMWGNADDYGSGGLKWIYSLQEQGKLLDENGEKLIDIQKLADGTWSIDFDTDDVDELAKKLNMTEDGFYAFVNALGMWMDVDTGDINEVAEKIDNLGLSVEKNSEKFVLSDKVEDALTSVYGSEGAYKMTQQLEECGYTLLSLQDIMDGGEEGAKEFFNTLSSGLVDVDTDEFGKSTMQFADFIEVMRGMGASDDDLKSFLGVLEQIDGLNFVDSSGNILSIENAIKSLDGIDITIDDNFTEVMNDGLAAADALREMSENEGLKIKVDVSDIEDVDDQVAQLDDTIAEMNEIKARPNVDASTIEKANKVIAACVAQKQALTKPAVMDVDVNMDNATTDIEQAIALLKRFTELQNQLELNQALGLDTTAIEQELSGVQTQIQAIDPTIKSDLDLKTGSKEEIEASIEAMKPEVIVAAGIDSSQIDGYTADSKDAEVVYSVNEDAILKYEPKDKNAKVIYKANTSNLPLSNSKTFNRTATLTYTVLGLPDGVGGVNGTAHASGTAQASGIAKVSGDWGAAVGGTTLVGELGPEIIVNPITGRWRTVGDNGAEFVNVPQGAIIFNHLQTESLLRDGYVTGRGRAMASGTAAANIHGSGKMPGTSSSSSSSSSTSSSKSSSKSSTSKSSSNLEESMKDALDEIKEELDKLLNTYEHEIFMGERNGVDIDEIISVYKKAQEEVHQYAEKFRAKGLDENSEYITDLQQQWWNYADEMADAVSEYYDKITGELENGIELNERWMENAFDDGDLVAAEKYSNTIIGYYKDLQDTIHEEAERYRALGYSDTSEEVSTLSNLWWDYADKIKEVKQKVVDNLIDMVDAASDAVDEIQDVFDTLKKAADEFEDNGGFVSVDTFQELAKLGPQYMSYLADENGMLVINKERINDVIAAKTEQLAIETALNYVERIRLATQSGSVESLDMLLSATADTTNATWGLVYANYALIHSSGKLTDAQYEAGLKNLDAWYSLAQNVKNGIDVTIGDSVEDMKNGTGDILDYVMDMLADRLDQQIEGLEDLKDDFADIVDLKKESLELTEKENDYQDEVADKVKEIAKLQERINALELDDSREAQSEKAKLYEEMADLQKELSDTQSDYAIEAQKDSLDKMQEAYEAEKDIEIEELEKTASSYEKRYQQAIKYIEDNWETLYDELINWNTEYGDSLNRDIADAWESCCDAVKKYGSYVEALNALNSTGSSSSSGSNTTIAGSVERPTSSDDDEIRARITSMYRNSQSWHDNGSNQSALAAENKRLAAELLQYGIVAEIDHAGVWRVNGVPLYTAYKEYIKYHTGGVVGDNPDLKQNEMMAVLEKGEVVLDKKKESVVYQAIDFASVLSKKLGVALNGVDLPSLFHNPGLSFAGATAGSVSSVSQTGHTITFGDTYIYGSNDETVQKHKDVSRNFVNEILDKLNIRK